MSITHSDLSRFTGTEHHYRHALMRSVLYSDGAKYLADEAGAHWLLDKVATLQLDPKVRAEEFQVWKLRVGEGNTATLACDDGNDNVVHSEKIGFTDFPLDGVDLYFANNVIHLPSEY